MRHQIMTQRAITKNILYNQYILFSMNKLLLVAGIALLAGAFFWQTSAPIDQDGIPDRYIAQFAQFKQSYNKKYSSSEESFRLAVFYANSLEVETHNANPEATWEMGINQFADLTQEEFTAIYLTLWDDETDTNNEELYVDTEFLSAGPVDWRKEQGVATKVKNQGSCGSCWAFATVGAIEAYQAKVQGKKGLDLSEQQLVDCAKTSHGCSGGLASLGLAWVGQNGITTEAAYPYTARDGTCQKQTGEIRIGGGKQVAGDQASHESAITQRPIAVSVDASNWSKYKSGILSECGTSNNHAVTAFGFDKGYWLIKNSWGTAWGENGYIRIKDGNTCNVFKRSFLAV